MVLHLSSGLNMTSQSSSTKQSQSSSSCSTDSNPLQKQLMSLLILATFFSSLFGSSTIRQLAFRVPESRSNFVLCAIRSLRERMCSFSRRALKCGTLCWRAWSSGSVYPQHKTYRLWSRMSSRGYRANWMQRVLRLPRCYWIG